VLDGGFGEKIARFYGDSDVKVKCYGLEKKFLDRYDYGEVLKACRLDATMLAEDAADLVR
jgi:1-deoxy-D-xylulose-5-phosphate synthase